MSSFVMASPSYLSTPVIARGINKSALLSVALLHGAVACVLFGSWTATKHPPAAVKTLTVQLYTMPQPVVEPIKTVTPPPEPVANVSEAKPEDKPVIVKQDLAFERVKKSEPEEQVKPVIKKKVQPKVKPAPIETVKPKAQKTITPKETKPSITETKKVAAPMAANTQAKNVDENKVSAANSGNADNIEQYLPIVKTAPHYPQGAIRKNLEGDCTVQYDVNTQGQVESPKIVGTCHPVFKRPSLAAAKEFRYKPRLINGKAVVVKNIRNTFEYRFK